MAIILNLIKDKWYVLFYLLVNLGFVCSFNMKGHLFCLDYILIALLLILVGFFLLNFCINYFQRVDRILEKYDINYNFGNFFKKVINHPVFIKFCKYIFPSNLILIPLLVGYQIKDNPTILQIFLNICSSFLFILISTSCIYQAFIKKDYEKQGRAYFLYVVLAIFFILNIIYPQIFSFFLENFGSNFTDVVVISLTLVLMTATLALLAFTYNTVLKNKITKNKMKNIGVDYFKSTLFVIFFSFGLFELFLVLKFFNLHDWSVLLNGDYGTLVLINTVCIIVFISAYFMNKFLGYFLKATNDCLKEFNLI